MLGTGSQNTWDPETCPGQQGYYHCSHLASLWGWALANAYTHAPSVSRQWWACCVGALACCHVVSSLRPWRPSANLCSTRRENLTRMSVCDWRHVSIPNRPLKQATAAFLVSSCRVPPLPARRPRSHFRLPAAQASRPGCPACQATGVESMRQAFCTRMSARVCVPMLTPRSSTGCAFVLQRQRGFGFHPCLA